MKNNFKALIIDDELSARDNLRYLLKNYCPSIEVISEASSVDNAVQEIKKHNPDVVFLDIEMPQKNGFQLLDAFDSIYFQIVFVTAYDTYAIKAFEIAALDYLLKPVDIERLKEVENKICNTIQNAHERIQLLKANNIAVKKLAVPYKSDYAILNVEDIICVEADRMYSILHLKNAKKYVVAKKMRYYESLLSENNQFVRVHRSWLLNTNHNISYSKKEKLLIVEGFKIPVSKSYKEQFEAIYMS